MEREIYNHCLDELLNRALPNAEKIALAHECRRMIERLGCPSSFTRLYDTAIACEFALGELDRIQRSRGAQRIRERFGGEVRRLPREAAQ